jgi:hypothetical protein
MGNLFKTPKGTKASDVFKLSPKEIELIRMFRKGPLSEADIKKYRLKRTKAKGGKINKKKK